MNKTSIEWTDYTWNPVTGCLHGCSYCYARRFAERGLGEYGKHPKGERFGPTYHRERLMEPTKLKKPSKIFVCSMGDLFGDWVGDDVLEAVLTVADFAEQHTYQYLTKNAKRYKGMSIPGWAGVTVTSGHPDFAIDALSEVYAEARFISFEPLLEYIEMPEGAGEFIDWIIIGQMTGRAGYEPKPAYVDGLLWWAHDNSIPVFLKDNLNWPEKRQEFPLVEGRV